MMGELVLNEVEGKEFFFTIRMVYFRLDAQYSPRAVGATSRRPAFHPSILMAKTGCH